MMRLHAWLIMSSLGLLAACNNDPAPPEEQPITQGSEAAVTVSGPERHILAFGDSLFAAYGLEKAQGYPARLQTALRAKGINAVVEDAGVSGDTTAAGRQRIAFVLDGLKQNPDLVIVELGGNDLLRAIRPAETQENLAAILDELKQRGLPVMLMGMRAPPNLGADFVKEFDAIYPSLAEEYGTALVPFFLEPTYNQPSLIQQDRIHPTADGIDALVEATAVHVAAALPKAE